MNNKMNIILLISFIMGFFLSIFINLDIIEGTPKQTPTPTLTPLPKLQLKPQGNIKVFYNNIIENFDDSNSDGVFISMLYAQTDTGSVFLDGSGSIIKKNLYEKLYTPPNQSCEGISGIPCCFFGFLWDSPYNKLVDFLFTQDADTVPFGNCINTSTKYDKVDFCKLLNKTEPNRSSTGLQNILLEGREGAMASDCINRKLYTNNIIPEQFSSSCFKSITSNQSEPSALYNEGVILNKVNENGIEIHEGLQRLLNMNKPIPVALIFLSTENWGVNKCKNEDTYTNNINALRLNFTDDTVVINIVIPTTGNSGLKFNGHTTLKEM